MVNSFIEKLHPRRSNLIAQSSIAFHNANAKYIYIYNNIYIYALLYKQHFYK